MTDFDVAENLRSVAMLIGSIADGDATAKKEANEVIWELIDHFDPPEEPYE